MENIWLDPKDKSVWHCPRCGSIKTRWYTNQEETDTPMIVARLADLVSKVPAEFHFIDSEYQRFRQLCHRLGIYECLDIPENRPTV